MTTPVLALGFLESHSEPCVAIPAKTKSPSAFSSMRFRAAGAFSRPLCYTIPDFEELPVKGAEHVRLAVIHPAAAIAGAFPVGSLPHEAYVLHVDSHDLIGQVLARVELDLVSALLGVSLDAFSGAVAVLIRVRVDSDKGLLGEKGCARGRPRLRRLGRSEAMAVTPPLRLLLCVN